MTPRVRTVYAVAMVLLFMVLAPSLAFYSLGYRLDLHRYRLLKTGIIVVASSPRGAAVFLDGRRHSRRTPVTIRNLIPGVHRLRLERPGYAPWEEPVLVRPTASALVNHVVLVRQPSTITRRLTLTGDQFTVSPDQTFLAWRSSPDTIHSVSLRGSDERRTIRQPVSELLGWSPFNRYLLARTPTGLLAIDRALGETIAVPFKPTLQRVRWDQANDSFVYLLTDTATYQLDLFQRQLTELSIIAVDLLARGESWLVIERGDLTGLTRQLVERRAVSYERGRTWDLPPATDRFLTETFPAAVTAAGPRLTLIDGLNRLTRTLSADIAFAAWSDNRQLLVGTDNELWVFDERLGDELLLGRYAGRPDRARWLKGRAAVITQVGRQLLFVATDHAAQPYQVTLREIDGTLLAASLEGQQLVTLIAEERQAVVESSLLF